MPKKFKEEILNIITLIFFDACYLMLGAYCSILTLLA